MSKIIEAYPLEYERTFYSLKMPTGAEILHIHMNKQGRPLLYAVIDKDTEEEETRTLAIVGTNEALPSDDRVYLGCMTTNNGMFLWHVFEIFERKD